MSLARPLASALFHNAALVTPLPTAAQHDCVVASHHCSVTCCACCSCCLVLCVIYELLIVCLCTDHMHVTLQQQALACSVKHVFSDTYSLLHAGQVMLNMPGERWVSYCACMIKVA